MARKPKAKKTQTTGELVDGLMSDVRDYAVASRTDLTFGTQHSRRLYTALEQRLTALLTQAEDVTS